MAAFAAVTILFWHCPISFVEPGGNANGVSSTSLALDPRPSTRRCRARPRMTKETRPGPPAAPRSGVVAAINTSGAIGRLHGVESVAPINKGTGRRGLALCIWIKDADRAAPCMSTLRLGSGPCVRRLSYECGAHRSRSLSRRTRHPPPHHLFERRFTAPPPQRPVRGRQQTGGIPISPRGPTCSHHSGLAARAHALCQRDETSGVCERG